MTPRTVAYLRVSTDDQDLEKNKADILFFANERNFGKVEFVEEKVSGRKSWKDRKIKGGGGTSFQCIEDKIQEIVQKEGVKYPKAVFVITDGYAWRFNCEQPKNWYWFLTEGRSTDAIPEESHTFNLRDYE